VKVKTRVFVRLTQINQLAVGAPDLAQEVNEFLETLTVNQVLDVRYQMGSNPGDHPALAGKLYYIATVLYLEN
jgi:hypothetical protein